MKKTSSDRNTSSANHNEPCEQTLALKRENERLRAEIAELKTFADNLFEAETHGVFLIDGETGRIEKANAAASRIYGFDNGELLGKSIPDLSTTPQISAETPIKHVTFVPLRHHVKKNGKVFPIEASVKYFTRNGKPMHFATIRDISLRQSVLEKLHLAETIVENSPVALFQYSAEKGRPIEFASENVRRFGYDPEQLAEDRVPFESLIHPDDRQRVAREMASACDKGLSHFFLRYRLLAQNGDASHVEENVFAQPSLSGRVAYFQGAVVDLSEQMDARRAQMENEALFQALFSAVQDAIYVLDGAFRILILNQAGSRRHGMSRGEMIGEIYPSLFPEKIAKRCGEKLNRVLKKEQSVRFVNTLEGRRFDCSAYPIRDSEGRVAQIAVFSRDVTNAYAIRKKLREAKRTADVANQAKSDYLAAMSHEIRTPIHAVNGMVDLLLDSTSDAETAGRLKRVKATMAHLNGLISNILDLSKIESGRLELESADFDLIELIRSAAEDMESLAARKGLEFRLEIAENTPRFVRGDPLRLRQIVLNLGSNAVKFTDSGSVRLRLEGEEAGDGRRIARLTVADSGIGIPPERRAAIFEAFQQADGTYARKYGGTGLGLAICKQLAELMGGEISIESGEDRGSVFTLRIALEQGFAENAAAQPPVRIGATRVSPKRILLAEDNPVNSEVAMESLERAGHEVAWAKNGVQAIDLLSADAFDLILMDVEMPEMDGIEATQRIRNGEAGKEKREIPVIGVTAHALAEIKNKCINVGMNVCVTKPVDFKSLLEIIESFSPTGTPAAAQPRTSAPLRSGSSTGILNKSDALARLMGNAGLYEKILADFFERASETVAAMNKSVLEENHAETAALSHAFAGSLAAIGAETSQALAKGLVTAAKEKNEGQIAVLFELLKEELEKVNSLLIDSTPDTRPPSREENS